jgi:hypothetical protein
MAQIILDSNNNLIQGDFDNATLNNRTKLQTTTTNATTNVYVVPNGSSTSAGVSVANNSSLTNASKIVMATNGTTDTQIISGVNGSGAYLPMSFYVNNALAFQYGTAGQFAVGSGAAAGTSGQVLTSGGASAAPSWTTISTAQVQTAMAGSSEGDLGTYAFLYQPSGGYTQGATVAGSTLNWISLYASALGGATAYTNTVNATTLSGTWKAMNKGNYSGSGAIGVWLRIA